MTRLSAVPEPEPIHLDALRALVRMVPGNLVFTLKRAPGGFVLFFGGMGKGTYVRGCLMAEKSKQRRVFARAETAFRLLSALGADSVNVDLSDRDGGPF